MSELSVVDAGRTGEDASPSRPRRARTRGRLCRPRTASRTRSSYGERPPTFGGGAVVGVARLSLPKASSEDGFPPPWRNRMWGIPRQGSSVRPPNRGQFGPVLTGRDHLRPEADTLHDILHAPFAWWGCRSERPSTTSGRGCTPALGAGADRSPCTAGARFAPRGRRPAPGCLGAQAAVPSGLPLHGPPRRFSSQDGLHSYALFMSQRVPERFGTAPGARSGSCTAGPLSDRPPPWAPRPVPPRSL